MRLELRGPSWTEALKTHAERRFHFALARFSRHLSAVTVWLLETSDVNAGAGFTCRISATIPPQGRIAVEDTQPEPSAAIAEAAERAGRAVARALVRDRYQGGASRSK